MRPRGGGRRWALSLMAMAAGSVGCAPADTKTSDPVPLGMLATTTPYYDDGETVIYQVARPISLPLVAPTDAERAQLGAATPPFAHAPWLTNRDVKVQISWTLSNLDSKAHNAEILIDPWNEFARYVPALNVSDEAAIPDLSGIQLLMRIEGLGRRSGTFTFDDLDELASDLATVQNLLSQPPVTSGVSLNGKINHAFDLQNRTGDGDKLLAGATPSIVPGLVGFDLGLRSYEAAALAIEIVVELRDDSGNRLNADAQLRSDGTMWIAPETNISAPMAEPP